MCRQGVFRGSLKYGQRVTGAEKVYAVLGGSHLAGAGAEQLGKTVAFLKDLNLAVLALNHCTGIKVQSMMMAQDGLKFMSANTGDVLEF